jgi:hypothetical protein
MNYGVFSKGLCKNNFPFLSTEPPVWQGVRTAHTPRYEKDEQRRQMGWIHAPTGEVIFSRVLRVTNMTKEGYTFRWSKLGAIINLAIK